MASMIEILPRREIADEMALRVWVSEALAMKWITRSQWAAIIEAFSPLLPSIISLSCRTSKGVLYVNSFDPRTARLTTYYLNHRAKWIKKTPPAQRAPEPRQEHQTWKLV